MPVGCSTPFGINEVGTAVNGTREYHVSMCSTPFGINEVGTWNLHSCKFWNTDWCSTPFGINEVGTFFLVFNIFSVISAQRLSASMRLALFRSIALMAVWAGAQRLSASMRLAP